MNILIIDEDPSLHDLIKQSSIASFCNIYFPNDYEDYEELFIFIKDNNIHVIIADLDRNKKERLILLKKIKTFDPLLDMIMVGKSLAPEEVVDLINQGASDYLARPLQLDSIQKTLKNIINKKALRRKTFLLEKSLEKKYSFHGIIGKSPYMLEIFSLIEKISKYFSSVLVIGETGTGKEMVARAIHNLSQVNNKNLVICDCVSIPENLFESELFGYAKGAFTGAYKDKNGLFEEAHNGIIFLDEIGEIPLSIQAKLLRVLEHHQFRPLGSNKIRNVEIRAIAATSRDLRKDIESGTFRKDLFHRLNKVEIHLPPLRKRPEDIPLLARHFLNHYSKKFSKKIEGVSQEAQKIFLRYEWPGNVREL
ncbi:MAG: sigma-54-dependent Fis family transcriptional regulator, partial [Candidatus Aminicenantes bacterium]|nr:sigma-54-dependent Fis family transcriptional regulator [Candidatus Aminicenantes bacterium]